MKKYIIDGYNLMHQMSDLVSGMNSDLQGVRAEFLSRLSEFAVRNRVQVHVVFDGNWVGSGFSQKRPHVKVQFSNPPEKADPVIKKMCDQYLRNRQVQVITSDREIRNYAKLCGLQSIASEDFAGQLDVQPVKPKKKRHYEPELSEAEVAEWVRLFEGKRQ